MIRNPKDKANAKQVKPLIINKFKNINSSIFHYIQ